MGNSVDEQKELVDLRVFLAEVFDREEEEITEDADFMKDLGLSSLMALEVMVALEKRYHVKIKEEELPKMTCLKEVYRLLKEKQGKFNV